MAVTTIIKAIKQVHNKDIVIARIGTFYHSYGRDSYILSYIFGYKLKCVENQISSCGFPAESLPKVLSKLEEYKINYVVVDRRNNYEKIEESDNKNLNTYDKYFIKSKKYVNLKSRIDEIYNSLIEEIEKENIREKINRIEEIIYEGRKV